MVPNYSVIEDEKDSEGMKASESETMSSSTRKKEGVSTRVEDSRQSSWRNNTGKGSSTEQSKEGKKNSSELSHSEEEDEKKDGKGYSLSTSSNQTLYSVSETANTLENSTEDVSKGYQFLEENLQRYSAQKVVGESYGLSTPSKGSIVYNVEDLLSNLYKPAREKGKTERESGKKKGEEGEESEWSLESEKTVKEEVEDEENEMVLNFWNRSFQSTLDKEGEERHQLLVQLSEDFSYASRQYGEIIVKRPFSVSPSSPLLLFPSFQN